MGEKVCVHRFAHSQQQAESWRGESKGESEQLGAVELEGAAVDKEPEVSSRRGTVAGSRWRCLLHGGRWVPFPTRPVRTRLLTSPLYTEPHSRPLLTECDCSLQHEEAELGTQGRSPSSPPPRRDLMCEGDSESKFLPCFDI